LKRLRSSSVNGHLSAFSRVYVMIFCRLRRRFLHYAMAWLLSSNHFALELVYTTMGKSALDHNASPRELWRGIRNAVLITLPVWLLLFWAFGFLLR
jgi:hypothetical protein